MPKLHPPFFLMRGDHVRELLARRHWGQGALAEGLGVIENRASYGENASGRYLTGKFGAEPFGWDFDVVRLLVVCLVRAGKVETTCKGKTIDHVPSVEAKEVFPKNNQFNAASFRPKEAMDESHLLRAVQAFKEAFGEDVKTIEQGVIARQIREAIAAREGDIRDAYNLLVQNTLPGRQVLETTLEQCRAITSGKEDAAILSFNGSYVDIRESVKRAREILTAVTEPRLLDLRRAREILGAPWSFLDAEADAIATLPVRAALH